MKSKLINILERVIILLEDNSEITDSSDFIIGYELLEEVSEIYNKLLEEESKQEEVEDARTK